MKFLTPKLHKFQKAILESFAYWPKCAVMGCENGVCLALDSKYCHPHTMQERERVGVEISLSE